VSVTGGHWSGPKIAAVDVKKVVGAIVVIFVLFFVISQPRASADFVLNILHLLENAANAVVLFLRSLFS
jgi:hypothetical protein